MIPYLLADFQVYCSLFSPQCYRKVQKVQVTPTGHLADTQSLCGRGWSWNQGVEYSLEWLTGLLFEIWGGNNPKCRDDHLSWISACPLSSQTTHLLRALDWPWCDWYHGDQNSHLEERSSLPQSLVHIHAAMGRAFISSTRRQGGWFTPKHYPTMPIITMDCKFWRDTHLCTYLPSLPEELKRLLSFVVTFQWFSTFDASLNYLCVF